MHHKKGEEPSYEEDLEEELPEEHLREVPFFNRFVVPVISVLLLLLLISYFVLGPIHTTIRGQLASSALKNDEYQFGDYLLLFYNDTAGELESIYQTYQEEKLVETSVCLQGLVYNHTYAIQDIYYPKIYSASFSSVTFEPCPKDTVVMLHTHPYKSCLASDQDLKTLEKNKEGSPDLLMLVMCEQRRYTLYD
ncbi:MAG: hypothetical protein KC535_04255 [Nanoarchaeota archaeon]|nr:hypothetical protein [Nanoarchaeota archaeon]